MDFLKAWEYMEFDKGNFTIWGEHVYRVDMGGNLRYWLDLVDEDEDMVWEYAYVSSNMVHSNEWKVWQ